MHASVRRWTRSLGGAAVTALITLQACSDEVTRPDPTVAFASGGGGGGLSVDAADPNSATQDTTLDVRVIGSGFDDGSAVTLLLAGQSTPKIVTNATRFVDRNTLIATITIAADADTALYDIQVTTSRGKKGQGSELFQVNVKGGKPGDPVVYVHTLHDLGAGSVASINDAGVMVGSLDDQPVIWWDFLNGPPAVLPTDCGVSRLNGAGTAIVGTISENSDGTNVATICDLDPVNRTVLASRALPPLPPYNRVTASGVNDQGQVVGQSSGTGSNVAVIWEQDAGGTMVPRALGELAGHTATQWAQSINNAGHVVGRSGSKFETGARAVLWFLEADGSVSEPLDLTADSDYSGDNMAVDLTEPVNGTIWVSGYGNGGARAWKVDLALRQVIERYGLSDGANYVRLTEGLEIVVPSYWGPTVWQPLLGTVDPLPEQPVQRASCPVPQVFDIGRDGAVVGYSFHEQKVRGGWECLPRATVWTRD